MENIQQNGDTQQVEDNQQASHENINAQAAPDNNPQMQINDNDNEKNLEKEEVQEIKEVDQSEIIKQEKDITKALELKDQGNKLFQEKNYNEAIEKYEDAIQFCPNQENKTLAALNSNIALCYKNNNDYDSVIHYTTEAINQDKTFKKAYLNRVIAFEKTEKIDEALEDLKEVEKLDPNDVEVKKKIVEFSKKADQVHEKQKQELFSNLKDIGNKLLGIINKDLIEKMDKSYI